MFRTRHMWYIIRRIEGSFTATDRLWFSHGLSSKENPIKLQKIVFNILQFSLNKQKSLFVLIFHIFHFL
jgi:hypothetical protein